MTQPNGLFVERHEFSGELSAGDVTIHGLPMQLTFSRVEDAPIRVETLGGPGVMQPLSQLWSAARETPILLKSATTISPSLSISSDEVRPGTLGISGGLDSRSFQRVAAELDLRNVNVTRRVRTSQTPEIVFGLVGQPYWWNLPLGSGTSTAEEAEVLSLDPSDGLHAELNWSVFNAWDADDKALEYRKRVAAITVRASADADLSEEALVNAALRLVDDLVVLVSFAGTGWVDWFRYDLLGREEVRTHLRRTRLCSAANDHRDRGPVDPRKRSEFLIRGLQGLRKNSRALDVPLAFYITSSETNVVDLQYAGLFLCLERLKDQYAAANGLERALPDADFARLCKDLRRVVGSRIEDKEDRRKLYEKMRELNRPSFYYVLNRMMAEYGVEWDDLYPPQTKPSLVATRDQLFHSSTAIDFEQLSKESDRLAVLVGRLLLARLHVLDLKRELQRWEKERFRSCGKLPL